MQYTPEFEIPSSVREIAGKSVEQAKDAYGRFVEAARTAQDMVSKSTEVFASGAREMNEKVFGFAEANTKASFEFATRLAHARDVKEALEIQTAVRPQPDGSIRTAGPGNLAHHGGFRTEGAARQLSAPALGG